MLYIFMHIAQMTTQLSDVPKIQNFNYANSAEPALFIFMHLCDDVYLIISAVMFLKEKHSLLSFSKGLLLKRMHLLLHTLQEALIERLFLWKTETRAKYDLKMIFRSTKGKSRRGWAAFACHAWADSSGMMWVVMTCTSALKKKIENKGSVDIVETSSLCVRAILRLVNQWLGS